MNSEIREFLLVAVIVSVFISPRKIGRAQEPQPTPTIDRLAIPTLPANPTQIDIGRHLYYYNCMPCHGDYGQGLTDEFRGIWVEDHQNCWGRGCHSGRPKDEGFPIPKFIPPVNDTARSLQKFPAEKDLYTYLRSTHPPQNPGCLKDEDYQALSAYLFSLAGRDAPFGTIDWRALAFLVLAGMGVTALLMATILPQRLRKHAGEIHWKKPMDQPGDELRKS